MIITINKVSTEYVSDIIEIAYKQYEEEFSKTEGLVFNEKEAFSRQIEDAVGRMDGYVALVDEHCVGYLLFNKGENGDETNYYFPVWGYGSNTDYREKVISKLFCYMADIAVKGQKTCFRICVYAHDVAIQRLFSYMKFSMQSLEGMKLITACNMSPAFEVYELSKDEMQLRWNEVWQMVHHIVEHLQKSPVFYPGHEFTEEVYHDFLFDESTRVYVAKDCDHLIGMIETNSEERRFLTNQQKTANIGEAYVAEEYRGKGLAQELLLAAESGLAVSGVDIVWVEHGTANANARGFWDKYFKPYQYEMFRVIEPV